MNRWFYIFLITLSVLFALNLFCGSVHIPVLEVADVLLGKNADDILRFIIIEHRLPQAITALFVGASLSVAGLLLQTAFHNPLAGPSVLGISGGASLGVAVVMLGAGLGLLPFEGTWWGASMAAFVGAMAVTTLLLFLSNALRNNIVLLITGMLLGYLISAVITILYVVATPEGLQSYVIWGMGDFSSVAINQLFLLCLPLIILVFIALLMIKPMNALLLGDSYAQNLGINIRRTRNLLLVVVGGITAVCTTFCGPVSFIGLAVPHIARLVCRTDNFRLLMPMTLLMGSVVALLCNLITVIPANIILPLNAVTPLIGVPVIIYVIIGNRHRTL